MKKRRTRARSTRRNKQQTYLHLRYILIPLSVLLVLFIAHISYKYTNNPHVLGASSLLLTDNGSQSSSDDNGGIPGTPGSSGTNYQNVSSVVINGAPPQEGFKSSAPPLSGVHQNSNIDIKQNDTEIEMHNNGILRMKGEKPDEEQFDINSEEGMDEMHQILHDKGIEISSTSGGFMIRSGSIAANTKFPISVDPVTKSITITTPAGIKTIPLLPDQAIKHLLDNKILSNIASGSSQESSNSANPSVTLTERDNHPVFLVNGTVKKNILGIIPATFSKKVEVSAETGQVIDTQQSFLSKLLETLSF